MRAIDDPFPIWHFFHAVDEDGTLVLQLLNHKAVVNDLLTYVDRRAESLECNTDDIYGSHHAGTEAARLKQQQRFFVLMYGHNLLF